MNKLIIIILCVASFSCSSPKSDLNELGEKLNKYKDNSILNLYGSDADPSMTLYLESKTDTQELIDLNESCNSVLNNAPELRVLISQSIIEDLLSYPNPNRIGVITKKFSQQALIIDKDQLSQGFSYFLFPTLATKLNIEKITKRFISENGDKSIEKQFSELSRKDSLLVSVCGYIDMYLGMINYDTSSFRIANNLQEAVHSSNMAEAVSILQKYSEQ
jgi:hypothetical protein